LPSENPRQPTRADTQIHVKIGLRFPPIFGKNAVAFPRSMKNQFLQAVFCPSSAKNLLFGCKLCLLVIGSAFSASAANLYWDIDGTTAGGSGTTAATGTWNATNANWSTSLDGNVTTAAWTAGETAVFSAGSDVTGSSTITISGNQTAAGIVVEEGTVSLAGNAVVIGGGTITVNSGATLSTDSSLRVSATAGAILTINGPL